MIYLSKNEKETQKIAGNLALKTLKLKDPVVIILEGELGAGKTTFVRGFAKALGIKAKIKSPTFNLMKGYKIPRNSIFHIPYSIFLVHIDCYRVRDHRDLATLDLKTLFRSPQNIVLIEWPEGISKILPNRLIKVHIDHIGRNERKIQIVKSK